ncbi:MAG: hypothetical protein AABX34_03250 [Nanoarchaeota archaeon]
MTNKSRETNLAVYAVIGIVAIVAVVSLSSLSGNKKTATTDAIEDMDDLVLLTASLLQHERENCLSLTKRPCYMRGAKAPQYWTQVGEQGAEKAYASCLENPVLTGEARFLTAVCGNDYRERVHFCYQGRGFAVYYLNGECV